MMGAYFDDAYDREMADAVNWPLVLAGPGFEVLDERCEDLREVVLAWRVGGRVTLPVTRAGFQAKGAWVVYPDGSVNYHGLPGPSAVPGYVSRDAWWRDQERMQEEAKARPDADRRILPFRGLPAPR
jgi:hypothetical protein